MIVIEASFFFFFLNGKRNSLKLKKPEPTTVKTKREASKGMSSGKTTCDSLARECATLFDSVGAHASPPNQANTRIYLYIYTIIDNQTHIRRTAEAAIE